MKKDLTDALAIAQEVLDQTGVCLLSGDFELFAECFRLPSIIDTFEGQITLRTRAELEARFRSVVAHYKSQNTTELVRNIIAVEWFDEKTIHSTHQGRVLSGSILMQAPYIVFSVLKHTGTRWQVTFSQYAISDSTEHNEALVGPTSAEDHTHD